MIYREYEIEAFEVGRGQCQARFRRTDRAQARGCAHAVGEGLKPAASTRWVFLLIWQARQSADSLSPAAGFEVRPKESAGKIERPIAVRTVFEGRGG